MDCLDERPAPVYREVPPGLITISDAARKYRRHRNTIRNWVSAGYLEEKGRLAGRSRLGQGAILIEEAELLLVLRFRRRQQFPYLR